MAEAAGHGADIHTSSNQLSGGVVPELVHVGVDADAAAHPGVAMGDAVGVARLTVILLVREQERTVVTFQAERIPPRVDAFDIRAQQSERLLVECWLTRLVGLRVL